MSEWQLDGRLPRGEWVGPLPPTDGAWMEPYGLRVMMVVDMEPEQLPWWRARLGLWLLVLAGWLVDWSGWMLKERKWGDE